MSLLYMILTIWNFIVFCIYAIDKTKAKKSARRIRETTLILFSYMFGSVGAMFSMVIFNHKTAKMKFRILIPLSVVLNYVLFYYIRIWFFS